MCPDPRPGAISPGPCSSRAGAGVCCPPPVARVPFCLERRAGVWPGQGNSSFRGYWRGLEAQLASCLRPLLWAQPPQGPAQPSSAQPSACTTPSSFCPGPEPLGDPQNCCSLLSLETSQRVRGAQAELGRARLSLPEQTDQVALQARLWPCASVPQFLH